MHSELESKFHIHTKQLVKLWLCVFQILVSFRIGETLNIIMVIKLRRMGGADHVARMVQTRNAHKISVGNLKGRDRSDD